MLNLWLRILGLKVQARLERQVAVNEKTDYVYSLQGYKHILTKVLCHK